MMRLTGPVFDVFDVFDDRLKAFNRLTEIGSQGIERQHIDNESRNRETRWQTCVANCVA